VGVTGLPEPTGRLPPLVRTAFLPGWATVVLALVLAVVWGGLASLPTEVRYLPLVASVLLLGLPHGALDHLTLSRARGTRPGVVDLLAFGVAYLVLGGAYALAWFLAPAAAFASFVLLTWFHWGQGDVWPLVAFSDGEYPATRRQRALTAVVRGGLPMVVPLVGFPERYRSVAETVVSLFDPTAVAALSGAFAPGVPALVGLGFGVVTLVSLGSGLASSGATPAWVLDAAETGLLWLFFLVVPPVLAVGLYFTLWHSLRHLVRLAALDARDRSSPRFGVGAVSLSEVVCDAVPLTAAAVGFLLALAALVPTRPASVPEFAGVYLVLLAALTLPHVVVVSRLDRLQGVWSAGEARR
jgi:Brp/Blh family beta-carotene 15,15'-monooxygenase